MGITIEPCVEDYWGNCTEDGASYIVKNYIGKNRFQQLDYYFWALQPLPDDTLEPRTTFNRINDLSKHVRLLYRKLYTLGTHLAVNKTIQRFTGRTKEIVNIPSKLTLEGFKIWVLGNEGYILD
jgi:hypothetical protein